MVDEADLRRMKLPPEVTGRTSKVEFGDLMKAARAVVPNLQHVAIVGDRWEQQNAYRHFSEEIPSATSGLDVIDLVGLPMCEPVDVFFGRKGPSVAHRISTVFIRTDFGYT